jgi:hypothetical protein
LTGTGVVVALVDDGRGLMASENDPTTTLETPAADSAGQAAPEQAPADKP